VADDVELGVELLAHLEHRELTVKEAIDRIETITTDPHRTRDILDTAVKRGVVEREDGVLRPRGSAYVSFESDVVRREGEFTCRRCGASISTGHFVAFDAGEHGPFGSSCIRKVTGRDR
jgi:formamidopyrimidine-DNA glycosylase